MTSSQHATFDNVVYPETPSCRIESLWIHRVPNRVPEDCLYIPDLHRPLLKSISGSLAASGMALICFSFHRRGKGGNWVEWVAYGSISYQTLLSLLGKMMIPLNPIVWKIGCPFLETPKSWPATGKMKRFWSLEKSLGREIQQMEKTATAESCRSSN